MVEFDAVAGNYDRTCGYTRLGQWQRHQVWPWLDRYLLPSQRVLELGCGTGIDALHLAERGLWVLATDPAPTMVAQVQAKARAQKLDHRITGQILAAQDLGRLTGTFGGCFSNFSGFNCVAELRPVAQELARVLEPGAPLLLVVFGRFCVWEMLGYGLRGRWSQATRRWQRGAVEARLGENVTISTYYHAVQALRTAFQPWFSYERTIGIGVAVPPIYAEAWIAPWAEFFQLAQGLDLFLGATWPYMLLADHQLVIWQRNQVKNVQNKS